MAYRDDQVRKAQDRARFHKRVAVRREHGQCIRCGKQAPEQGRSVCAPCAEKRRAAERARNARLKAAGKPRRDLEKARAYERTRARRRTAERLAQGLCTKCGRNPPEPDRRMCEPCAVKRRKAERERYGRAKAEGKPYGLSGAPDNPYYPELGFIPSDVAEVPCYALSRHIDSE